MAEKTEIVENEFNVDVAVRTIRGRACPICGGKIIPSNRAVYQSAGDPTDVYPLWECERCGHSEMVRRPQEAKKVHGAAAKPVAAGEKSAGVKALTGETTATATGTRAPSTSASRAAAKRAMPPDVRKMLEVMKGTQPKAEE